MKPILFPGLGLSLDINNVAFNIFGKDIYWYGIIITCGMLLAMLLAKHDKKKYGISCLFSTQPFWDAAEE